LAVAAVPTIQVEGLGTVEIAGEKPTPEEERQIRGALSQRQTAQRRSFLSEAIPQVVGGVRDGVRSVLNLAVNRPAACLEERFPLGNISFERGATSTWPTIRFDRGPYKPLTLPPVRDAETTAGKVTRGLSQFFVPFLGALRIVGKGATALQTFAKITAKDMQGNGFAWAD
jgi:hypothetical protein